MFRCHGESLQSIRKSLLNALNLRAEPRLPAGELDAVRGLWQSTFSVISQTDKDSAGRWNPKWIEATHTFSSLSLILCGFFFFDMLFRLQQSLCHLRMETVQAWSAAPWPLRYSWKVRMQQYVWMCMCTVCASILSCTWEKYGNPCQYLFWWLPDLGWNNWMIHPSSLTVVQCGLCDPETNAVQCPPSHTNVQDADSQVELHQTYYLVLLNSEISVCRTPVVLCFADLFICSIQLH